MRKLKCLVMAIGAMTLTIGSMSCGKPYKPLKVSGPPSALQGKTEFVVKSSYDNLRIGAKTEEEYLAEKKDVTKDKFDGDKRGMEEAFIGRLATESGYTVSEAQAENGEKVLITIDWFFIEPGFYVGVMARPTVVKAKLSFVVGGEVKDEIEVQASQQADIYHPSSGQRMRDCAHRIAKITARFYKDLNEGQ